MYYCDHKKDNNDGRAEHSYMETDPTGRYAKVSSNHNLVFFSWYVEMIVIYFIWIWVIEISLVWVFSFSICGVGSFGLRITDTNMNGRHDIGTDTLDYWW